MCDRPASGTQSALWPLWARRGHPCCLSRPPRRRRTPPNCHQSCQDAVTRPHRKGALSTRDRRLLLLSRLLVVCCSCARGDELPLLADAGPGWTRCFGLHLLLLHSSMPCCDAPLPLRAPTPSQTSPLLVSTPGTALSTIVVLVAISVLRAGRLLPAPKLSFAALAALHA